MSPEKSLPSAMVLIDGEHYPPVIESALESLKEDFHLCGALFLGGTEKVGSISELDRLEIPIEVNGDMIAGLEDGVKRFKPEVVIDLSDEPVLGYYERFKLANKAFSLGVEYRGADFSFVPCSSMEVSVPVLVVGGTGKRTGKTAVSAYTARLLKERFKFGVVTMGRGGPQEPEVLDMEKMALTPKALVELAKQGHHAASDHFEDALMSRVLTIGCRRCGGGLSGGGPFFSNVDKGVEIIEKRNLDLAIFEGSGSTFPPVIPDAQVTIVGAHQPSDYISHYFGPYRIRRSDLVVLTMCEEPLATRDKVDELVKIIKHIKDIPVVKTIFRPKPLADIGGEKVFVASTAPPSVLPKIRKYLEKSYGCVVTGVSSHLSDRPKLKADFEDSGYQFETLLVEVKAAGIDVAARIALEKGKKVVFMDNSPVPIEGEMDQFLLNIGENIAKR